MAPFLKEVIKSPDATLDYTLDWGDIKDKWLAPGETLASAICISTQPTELQILAYTIKDNSKVMLWLTGGKLNTDYGVTVTITTNSAPIARVDSRTLLVKIRKR